MSRHFGARLSADGRCAWRLWAPRATTAELVLYDASSRDAAVHPMTSEQDGFFSCSLPSPSVGQRYAFRLDGNAPRPDPASRWQPDGVHAPSALWRPDDFRWTDRDWPGIPLKELVIYELHVGTFTPQGTFAAIIPRLSALRDLGITAIELMPVGQFPGKRGWGYDGVFWFAVQQSYGGPGELQRLVDACHAHGLALILDVVYNHLGPEGNYLGEFGPFFTDRHQTPWGAAVNFDGPSSRAVRDFVLENVTQWIRDFHVDGLRLDAIHAIVDDSTPHILAEIKQVAAIEAERCGRPVHVIAESNLNDVRLLDPPETGGYGLDAQWSDDFHHCVHTLLTGERGGYYADFDDPPRQLVKSLNQFFVYDGCYSTYRKRPHGRPVGDHSGERFVVSIQTHDQVGNRACGDRFGTLLSAEQQRLAAGLLLLAPNLPLLFMGEEYGEGRPFPFFCEFSDEALREAVRKGRREEFKAFGWMGELPDPSAPETFASAILSWSWPDGSAQAGLRNLYRELLAWRRSHPALGDFAHRAAKLMTDNHASVLHLVRGDPRRPKDCLHAFFNLAREPVPLPAPAEELRLHSEEPRFGGTAPRDVLSAYAFAVFTDNQEAAR
jgi:maltooligosyltrehalose trehalohydrolase